MGDMGATVLDGHVYVFGGCDDSLESLSVVERLDATASAPTWEQLPAMHTPRDLPAVACSGHDLYVFGGHDSEDDALDTCERLCITATSMTWEQMPPMRLPRHSAAVIGFDGS